LGTMVDNLRISHRIQKLGGVLEFLNLVAASNASTMAPRDVTNVREQSGTTMVRHVNNNEPMEVDCHLMKLKASEKTLTGAVGGKLISETQLIRDCIFVMQNINGHYIKWSEHNNKYELVGHVKCNTCDLSIANRLCFLGFLLRQVRSFCSEREKDEKYGMIGGAALLAIKDELHNYESEVALAAMEQETFTLRSLALAFHVWMVKLRFLGYIVYNLANRKGGEILTVLNTALKHGNPTVNAMYTKIINVASRPFILQLDNWIYEGKLHDPNDEFFISADYHVPAENLWFKRYRVAKAMIPSFLRPTEAQKILLVGKSINFLREVCKQPLSEFVIPTNTDHSNQELDLNKRILKRLDETYESTSVRLLAVMTHEYKLNLHFKALRKYMLLGQGDFVRYLLDVLEPELHKPAAGLYKSNLSEHLTTAIQCTNAQYEDDEVLRSLDVRVHEVNPGDVGWDVFSLNYAVTGPLLTIFPHEIMRRYIRVFNFLLRAKRMEYNLNHLWGRMMSTTKMICRLLPETVEVFHNANLIATEMSSFVSQLQYYINFEILECSWAQLEEDMCQSRDMDELIAAHMEFLNKLDDGCLLSDHLWDNLKGLRSIFDQIVRFETKVYKVILEEAELEGQRRQFVKHREIDEAERQLREDFHRKLVKHKNKIGTVRQTYQQMIRDFLHGLNASSDANLRCLSWRLDFNNFYKDSKF